METYPSVIQYSLTVARPQMRAMHEASNGPFGFRGPSDMNRPKNGLPFDPQASSQGRPQGGLPFDPRNTQGRPQSGAPFDTEAVKAAREEIQALQKQYGDLRRERKHEQADRLQITIDEKVRLYVLYVIGLKLCFLFALLITNANANIM